MADAKPLRVRELVIAPGVDPISLTIAPGEIVGLAGLDGHGQERFLRALAGLERSVAGEIAVDGKPGSITSFRKAVAKGIAYLPRDRRSTGIFPTQSVLENFAISTVSNDRRFGLLSFAARRRRYDVYRQKLGIVAPRPDAAITTLSGGNQQKVLFSRWSRIANRLLILDEPTRGVDIGAKSEIYRIINDLARSGVGVIVISSELPEVIGVADRVLVMREGEIAGELGGHSGTPISQEGIIELATGSKVALDQAA